MPVDKLSGRFAHTQEYVTSASGAWLETERGPMLDYILGNCAQILGHCHPHVVEAVQAQVGTAVNVGDHRTRVAEALADRVLRHSGMDALRLVNTGSEAVHCALRVARVATGRPLIVRFDGHYHGWFAEEVSRFLPAPDHDRSGPPGTGDHMVALRWNDEAAFADLMAREGERVAAVICEPLLVHAGPVPPDPGYLETLRRLTAEHGALLIFDECITGFRLGLGGAQEHYGIEADLVTYSKAISAGFPMGVCAGRGPLMGVLEDRRVYQAATYDANPISAAAAMATLDVLEAGGVYERMRAHGLAVQELLRGLLAAAGVPAVCQGDPVVFQFFFTDGPVRDHAEAMATDVPLFSLLADELLERRVNLFKGDLRDDPNASWLAPWFTSAAHGRPELDFLAEAAPPALEAALERHRARQFA